MKKQNRITLILIVCLFSAAFAIGMYLFQKDEPTVVEQKDAIVSKPAPMSPEKDLPETVLPELPPTETPAEPSGTKPPTDAGASESDSWVSYPETLIDLLGIEMEDLLEGQDGFKNTVIHVEWMDRIHDVLKNLDPEKRAAIVKNHTALLYIKDKLNEAYLTGKIDHETFKKAIADLMKWHQRTYEAILTRAEYEALFEISPDQVDDTIDALIDQTPEYSFILNEEIPVEAVKEKVQGYKLEEVNSHFKKMVLDRDQIGKQINSGAMTLDQAREALNKSQAAFIAKCKEILTEAEIITIFGSVAALETGSTQTEPPAVLGDADETTLGFKIENPQTSIETVTEKIDAAKLEDIRFFYQERAAERNELIEKLDAGEIAPETVETISMEMDATFEENCRSVLTDAEYELIFGKGQDQEPVPGPDPGAAAPDSGASKTKNQTESSRE